MNRRRVAEMAQRYARCSADELGARLEQQLRGDPRCPVTRYVAGCWSFDAGRPATAVEHLMIAHHAEPELESAALLVFAGLNWVSRPSVPLLPVLLQTWEEFRRPEFDRSAKERALLDAFSAGAAGQPDQPVLTRRLWRVPIALLRAQLQAAVQARDTEWYALLTAPA
jgi:hypothetical protein